MSRVTHGPRTFELLRALGWEPGSVEKFNHYAGPFGIRQDLFGFIDVLAIPTKGKNKGVLAIQICSQSTYAAHWNKIHEMPLALAWLNSGKFVRFEIWAWSKRKAFRGSKAVRWWCNRYRILIGENNLCSILTDQIGPDHKWMKKLKKQRKKGSK